MNRRAFFGLIAGGLAAAADPERLLWVPGRKLISIPARNPAALGVSNYAQAIRVANLYLRLAMLAVADHIERALPAFYLASDKKSANDVLLKRGAEGLDIAIHRYRDSRLDWAHVTRSRFSGPSSARRLKRRRGTSGPP